MNGFIDVRVSGPMLQQKFHPCETNYIRGTCRGRCCEGSGGISVVVHPSEEERIRGLGAKVEGGYIVADERGLCPFKTAEGFCGIHGPQKPFGCQASPFTLTDKDLLVVRNRYRLLRCYSCEGSLPAYEAHRWSLTQIFGEAEYVRIVREVQRNVKTITGTMPIDHYYLLRDNRDHRNLPKPAEPAAEFDFGG